jgi:hypothetical protein
MPQPMVSGSFRIFFQQDICEEIRLDELRNLIRVPAAERRPSFRHPAPEYVRFERPPVVDTLDPVTLGTGQTLRCRMNYYDYGVVSIELELPFEFEWTRLVELSGTWIAAPELEKRAAEIVQSRLKLIGPALVKPYDFQLTEDYYIIQLQPIPAGDGETLSATELIRNHGKEIAQIVRGELIQLSGEEQAEVLHSHMSYYPNDLLVAGWTAALVYDTPEGAAPVIELLEFANTQLLEFRYYDHLLTGLLSDVYRRSLGRGKGILARWRLANEAERLNTIRLDVRELTERVDNSIKFLSDMFLARVYRLAAARIGVPDYRRLVDEKLNTAGELYQFMMDRFYQARAFVLELMIVIILIIELGYLFRGKT